MLGMIALQVDDTLCAVLPSFHALENRKSRRFKGTPAVLLSSDNDISFNGANLTRSADGDLSMQKHSYCQLLPSAPLQRTAQ
jgi:hypothetical protein